MNYRVVGTLGLVATTLIAGIVYTYKEEMEDFITLAYEKSDELKTLAKDVFNVNFGEQTADVIIRELSEKRIVWPISENAKQWAKKHLRDFPKKLGGYLLSEEYINLVVRDMRRELQPLNIKHFSNPSVEREEKKNV